LKGGSSNLGATVFITLCKNIEESASEGSFEGYESVKAEFETESGKVIEALKTLQARHAPPA
jgi:tRNA U54 and U55 pseudouridine synthase Pus10